jgi:hypothetical protein
LTDIRIDHQLRAEKQFKKQTQATEGAKALSEYKAAQDAEHAKTERLRALRLAKQAAAKKTK